MSQKLRSTISVVPVLIRERTGYGVLRGFEFVGDRWQYELVQLMRELRLTSAGLSVLLEWEQLSHQWPMEIRNTGVVWALGPLASDRILSTVISGLFTKTGEIGIVQTHLTPQGIDLPARHSFLVRLPPNHPGSAR
jgi:hypothetical protein